MRFLSDLIEMAGFAALVYASWLVSPTLAYAVLGVVLLMVGLGLSRRSER